jgi:hypothetical protein
LRRRRLRADVYRSAGHVAGFRKSIRRGWTTTHLNDVGMSQLAEVLDLSYGRHIQAIFKLAHFDLLDSYLAPCRDLTVLTRGARPRSPSHGWGEGESAHPCTPLQMCPLRSFGPWPFEFQQRAGVSCMHAWFPRIWMLHHRFCLSVFSFSTASISVTHSSIEHAKTRTSKRSKIKDPRQRPPSLC